jgi:hypothetical protein
MAIKGLEKRLLDALEVKGGFGIVDDSQGPKKSSDCHLFYSTLMWQRSTSSTAWLTPNDVNIPSWSWMSYEGSIDYLIPAFEFVEWQQDSLITPGRQENMQLAAEDGIPRVLTGSASIFSLGADFTTANLIYDDPRDENANSYCVVVAKSESAKTDAYLDEQDRRCYLLLVEGIEDLTSPQKLIEHDAGPGEVLKVRRIGVGWMPTRLIRPADGLMLAIY